MKFIISIGDCNGIGIEVMLKSLPDFITRPECNDISIAIAGRLDTIIEYSKKINFDLKYTDNSIVIRDLLFPVIKCQTKPEINFGKIDKDAGKLSAEAIELAVERTIAGKYDAMITMPVAKSALYLAGWKYPGHTEMLSDFCGGGDELMILSTDSMRVALATVHIPISKIAQTLTQDLLKRKIDVFNKSLIQDYGIKNPAIAVLGLNPHAGESGSIGEEEETIIEPVITGFTSSGVNVSGPFASDGIFAHGEYKNYDGIVAMYHDQGLIPLKFSANGGGVNFTAGLKIVRTSPDHGTAFAIAGRNLANPQSTLDALELARKIVLNRQSKQN